MILPFSLSTLLIVSTGNCAEIRDDHEEVQLAEHQVGSNLRGGRSVERQLFNSWECWNKNYQGDWYETSCDGEYKSDFTCTIDMSWAEYWAKRLCVAPTNFRVSDGGDWNCKARYSCGKF